MVIKTRPMDANGYFNFGAANLWHGAVASRAKVVIVETDPAASATSTASRTACT